ncbi:single-stranded DNA-binding protein [Helicobacter anatolicus]|uniref:single-stranded DNA-binding protein n=1 Tax=Helicobacter anatolicus TaxID=2905874 RepID=UPI001E355A7D|nr:single-stranded DNA-binding protein [Helicobacter anatolicus]MCE3040280.1 single-stranded DNA-binding protein [Helicobacter anatolicus]
MINFNKIIITGHITEDMIIKMTQNRFLIGTFSICYNEVKKIGEEFKTTPHFFQVKVLGDKVDYIKDRVKKGVYCLVSGKLLTERYTNHNGVEVIKIVLQAEDLSFEDKRQTQARKIQTLQEIQDRKTQIIDNKKLGESIKPPQVSTQEELPIIDVDSMPF